MPFGMEVGLGPDDFVLGGDPASPQKRAQPPQFSTQVCCGQTAGWIKMPLGILIPSGILIGLDPGDFVLDWDPALPQKGAQPPNFWPMSIVTKQLDASGYRFVRR